ncbi:uncharacterized protein LOC125899660 [Xyrichtys novacula]|uniref:Uncharacterized protein LOC125899660 n=1 Tax=Xyrichtys novacula TaxID=13765 RepID=A0AAV1FHT3_XYRNO|nr:uncharacterized protein LOC125899660 [Xyrichtys novacula]
MVEIPAWRSQSVLSSPNKLPLHVRVQEQFSRHHSRARSVVERAFGVMKTRWRAMFFKALEVSPAFASDIVACCAFLHNLCLTTNDVIELEEHVVSDGDL